LTAFDVACRWVARAPRSRGEIVAYLERLGFSAPRIDDTLARLANFGAVDDDALAARRAALLAARGYGDAYIAADLERRGIDAQTVGAAVDAIAPERERADAALAATGRGARRGAAARRVLAQRGFSPETADAILGFADDETGDVGM
jgi:SOS response regulatory protein OraA/RecX